VARLDSELYFHLKGRIQAMKKDESCWLFTAIDKIESAKYCLEALTLAQDYSDIDFVEGVLKRTLSLA
jgi:hypothetical protein